MVKDLWNHKHNRWGWKQGRVLRSVCSMPPSCFLSHKDLLNVPSGARRQRMPPHLLCSGSSVCVLLLTVSGRFIPALRISKITFRQNWVQGTVGRYQKGVSSKGFIIIFFKYSFLLSYIPLQGMAESLFFTHPALHSWLELACRLNEKERQVVKYLEMTSLTPWPSSSSVNKQVIEAGWQQREATSNGFSSDR